jgi:hypothetical protein
VSAATWMTAMVKSWWLTAGRLVEDEKDEG